MSEAVKLTEEPSYSDCIKLAYIEPIRTVTIIDDNYPTIDTLIQRELEAFQDSGDGKDIEERNRKWSKKGFEPLKALIKVCRHPSRSWGVDVYDGQTPDISDSRHINNSDLVILDYNLDPNTPTSGDKAVNCLRMLAKNNHFNLIIVHTSGEEVEIKDVFSDLISSLLNFSPESYFSFDKMERVNDFFDELEVLDDELKNRLLNSINQLDAIKIFEEKAFAPTLMKPGGILYSEKGDVVAALKDSQGVGPREVVWWLVNEKLKSLVNLIDGFDGQVTSWKYNDDCNWIASGRLFVTVVKKDSNQMGELPNKLLKALGDFEPSPLLLLMARMRFELEESGLLEATAIASKSDVQAAWLYQLLSANELSKDAVCNQILENHWDSMSMATRNSLRIFSKKMTDSLNGRHSDLIAKFFGQKVVDCPHGSVLALNAYQCSKEVSREHLTTGHILKIDDMYWVCLSPACDLVPDREKRGWSVRLGDSNMPFKAVKLEAVNSSIAIEDVSSNNYIFLNINGEYKTFEIPHGKSIKPQWEQMFALNDGKFIENTLDLQRIYDSEGGGLKFKTYNNIQVVSELRYEYALNLLQRLGSTLTRIGLSYEKKLWEL
ncbi:MAG: hypothetical protein ACI8VC_002907 [Candidatus Endobugula sp.]|jgi:hypothetical protein